MVKARIMANLFRVLGILLAIFSVTGCGRDSLEPTYFFDTYESPPGKLVREAETQCASLGMAFTPSHTLDTSKEAQAALDRPFLTQSGKMISLGDYVRAANELQKVFGPNAPSELEARKAAALTKIGQLGESILAADKNGHGGIYSNPDELSLFTEKIFALVEKEEAATKNPNDLRKGLAFARGARDFINRFGHDLASPALRLKMEAQEKKLISAAP